MYFQDFNGLDLLRAHASMTGLPITNGLDTGGNPLGLPLSLRDPANTGSSMLRSPPHASPNSGNNNSTTPNNTSNNNNNNNNIDRNSSPNSNHHNNNNNNNHSSSNGHLRPSSPRPGSANRHIAPNSHSGLMLSSLNALNLIQTPKPGLKPPTYSSPPPIPCNPEHNICKLIEYRGAKVAAFMVDSRELICLPQAFELFLKHLVGGLHTVYTKLKRLEITPIVCNVEQVRILRGLGAIQPGVNRCKLISCAEFDTLYEDCTNSNARPGRPPKRVHASTVDADVLDKLKRRKMDMAGEYPYDNRFYDRKLMNGFPHMGYPSMPQFPNLFNMHPLMQPAVSMAMASHISLRPEGGVVSKLDRTTSDSGIVSPRAREDRLGLLGMYGPHSGMDPRLPPRHLDMDSANKPLNLQINGHLKTDRDSEGSRTDDEVEGDEDKMSDEDRREDDDCYDSDEYQSIEGRENKAPTGPARSLHSPVVEGSDMGPQEPPIFADFDGFADKLNNLVQALVDQAKNVERRIGDEKNRVRLELVKEKERRLDLEKEVEEERRRREFFQRRVRRLKNALRLLPEEAQEMTSQPSKNDHLHSESSPEPVVRNTQESGTLDSDSDKALNSSISLETDRKSDSSQHPDRPPHRRDTFESSFTTPGRRSPGSPSPVKFQYHPLVAGSDV